MDESLGDMSDDEKKSNADPQRLWDLESGRWTLDGETIKEASHKTTLNPNLNAQRRC